MCPIRSRMPTAATALFAYVSLGEVSSDRAYLKDIPEAWKLGQNADWGSVVLDQSRPEWPAFFAEHVIKPLWDAGYRGFFLDTLDSYQRYAKIRCRQGQPGSRAWWRRFAS